MSDKREDWEACEVTEIIRDAQGEWFGGYCRSIARPTATIWTETYERKWPFYGGDLCRDFTTQDRVVVGATVWRRTDGAISINVGKQWPSDPHVGRAGQGGVAVLGLVLALGLGLALVGFVVLWTLQAESTPLLSPTTKAGIYMALGVLAIFVGLVLASGFGHIGGILLLALGIGVFVCGFNAWLVIPAQSKELASIGFDESEQMSPDARNRLHFRRALLSCSYLHYIATVGLILAALNLLAVSIVGLFWFTGCYSCLVQLPPGSVCPWWWCF